MIVYVESNFILELAYVRHEHVTCEAILALSEAGSIVLALPAYCVGEPYESRVRRSKDRRALHNRFDQEIKELSRSQPYSNLLKEAEDVTRILIQSGEDEKQRLDAAISRIIASAAIMPLTATSLQQRYGFKASAAFHPRTRLSMPRSWRTWLEHRPMKPNVLSRRTPEISPILMSTRT